VTQIQEENEWKGFSTATANPVTRETSIGKVNTRLTSAGFKIIDYLN
jgi:hypothetical protein